jgi:peptidoglycan DL-endopeptidase LytF
METFAYLHAAQEYEYPEEKEINLKWVNPAALTLLSIACSTGAANLASAAQAATVFRGDSGASVTRLQDLLRNAGYFPTDTTGFFGDFTEAAVQDFQQAKGLAVDGVAGYHTFRALETSVAPIAPITSIAPVTPIALVTPVTPIKPITPIAPIPGEGGNAALGFGDSGTSVTQLQNLLRRAGYFPGPSTGYFGAITRNSVKRFQEVNRLPADGFVDRATFVALESAPAV